MRNPVQDIRYICCSHGSSSRPARLWGPPSLLPIGYSGLFLRGNATGSWSWPLICI